MNGPPDGVYAVVCGTDPDVLDADGLAAHVGRLAVLRAWVDAEQVRATRAQRRLAEHGQAADPASSLTRDGKQSSKDAQAAAEREQVCAAMPGFEAALADGVVSAGHVDAVANAMALSNLSRVLTWAGKQEEAVRLAERATELAVDPHTLSQMVTVLLRNDRPEEALRVSAEAARLQPEVPDFRRIHGILLAEAGRNSEALPELEAAARLDPGMVDVHYHLGLVLSDLGQADRAERAYRRAIESDPGNADARDDQSSRS